MHILVIRKDVYERHPWIARSLYKAFCDAKNRAIDTMHISNAHACTLPWLSWEREQLRKSSVLIGGPMASSPTAMCSNL
jgi:4,5-dihydroxyphthalate decarboxylase